MRMVSCTCISEREGNFMRAFLSPSTIEEKKKRENVSSSLLHRIHRNVSEREREGPLF
jgi:hypothetical protein